MPKLYVLVGNIASGKSTWVKENCIGEKIRIVSRDNLRHMLGWTDYVFDPMLEPHIQNIIESSLRAYIYLGDDIVLDETSMNKRGRSWIWDYLAINKYEIIGIVFPDAGETEHVRRRMQDDARNCTPELWASVYRNMKLKYEEPTLEEGFTELVFI